jgi:hypothetical protein
MVWSGGYVDWSVLPQQIRTKRRKHILAILLQVIEMNYYKANCFWQNNFLSRTDYQNLVSIFPQRSHKFYSGWRLRSCLRIWTRKDQVTRTGTVAVRFIKVLVTLLKKCFYKMTIFHCLTCYFIILILVVI